MAALFALFSWKENNMARFTCAARGGGELGIVASSAPPQPTVKRLHGERGRQLGKKMDDNDNEQAPGRRRFRLRSFYCLPHHISGEIRIGYGLYDL